MKYSLYVHIPFCKRKCNYCDFPSYAGKENYIPDYIEALKAEVGYISSLYDSPEISTIYVGGGTPTLLSDGNLQTIFDSLRKDFTIAKDAEITVEANPGTVTKEKLSAMFGAGVNRISLGAQTFNNRMLKKLGRIHLAHETRDAFALIREAGFKNVNIDLIFSLPGENLKDWKETLKQTLVLSPEHISTYNLQIEEGTPFYGEKLEGSLKMPSEELELEMYEYAISSLKDSGYHHYEISNFAKEGHECLHNIAYWTLKDYIGIGAGAHSYLNGSRIGNTPILEKYLSRDFAAIKTEHKNTKKENMQEMVFLGLRLIDGFNLNDFTGRFGSGSARYTRKRSMS